eukprot:maker-scaffold425_size175135-snap-gene-0.41 protein:Tk05824 transcript:maker-scaffold425_size175135-snap-gene-0.41-mRNA-1 annotation:"splicing factor 45"
MSLYDDEEDVLSQQNPSALGGWSKGVNQLKPTGLLGLKKPPPTASPLLGLHRKSVPASPGAVTLAPVIDLQQKNRKWGEPAVPMTPKDAQFRSGLRTLAGHAPTSRPPLKDPAWNVINEYDPMWPNDFHRVKQDMKESKSTTAPRDRDEERRKYTESAREKTRERFTRDSDPFRRSDGATPSESPSSGFGRRPRMGDDYSDPEDEPDERRDRSRSSSGSRRSSNRHAGSSGSGSAGAAIAPPPSLMEGGSTPGAHSGLDESPSTTKMATTLASGAGLGVAAKIMARYGYRHGQGLGRDEQGMSRALAVEKTSRRGGRILHERDLRPPPPLFNDESITPPPPAENETNSLSTDEYGNVVVNPSDETEEGRPSITELMRNPSKVVLCKNMVGPGEVDNDLEPEVKEECHTKYGEVNKVIIFEIPNAVPEEAVRIFIEFKRVESAIKAVVDLNGRFFGGRQVQASFYNVEKFHSLKLHD